MVNNRGEFNVNLVIVGVVTLSIAAVLLIFGLIILNETYEDIEDTSASTTDSVLADNGTATTLSQTPTSLSATRKNHTWLSFDGVDDYLFISDNSYETISYWVNSSSTWTHVVNTSGILYEDGDEVTSLTVSSYLKNSTGWFIGMNETSGFFEGWIDSIKFYNDTIDETIVDTLYSNGR